MRDAPVPSEEVLEDVLESGSGNSVAAKAEEVENGEDDKDDDGDDDDEDDDVLDSRVEEEDAVLRLIRVVRIRRLGLPMICGVAAALARPAPSAGQ